ncbi:MarR family winged helix-turn-helix transcriptional regulator [Nibricoccus sp. IMCC34717]|uniref:MarR family winged helix-turn-helix transcriptional regulator n=1 Tax=Nibricoccus sp. IMCC34717 TaxID=3034021 RepID=UPI00384E659C
MDPSACSVLLHLLRTGDEAFRVMDENFSSHGMSEGRFTVLMLLGRRAILEPEAKGVTPAELAEMSGVTRATMTGLIDTLERDGLVVRRPDAADRRMMNVAITEKGRETMEKMLPEHFRRIGTLMADLTEEDRATLQRLLSKILDRAATFAPATGAETTS